MTTRDVVGAVLAAAVLFVGLAPLAAVAPGQDKRDSVKVFLDKRQSLAARKQAGLRIGSLSETEAPGPGAPQRQERAGELRTIALQKLPRKERIFPEHANLGEGRRLFPISGGERR